MGVRALSAGRAGRDRRRARRAHAVPIHAAGRRSRRAERLGAEDAREAARRCRNCATSAPTSRSPARRCTLTIDRDMASRFGIQPQLIDDTLYDAFGQRAGDAVFHADQHLLRRSRRSRRACRGDPKTLDKLYIRSPNDRAAGAAQRLRQMDDRAGGAAVDQPPGPVSGGDDQLQPRAGRGARPGDRGDPAAPSRSCSCRRRCRPRSRATRRRSRIRCRPCRC